MIKEFTINAINISKEDYQKIYDFKISYIDYIMSIGVFYSPTRFVSAILNNMLNHFNKEEILTIPMGGFEASEYDLRKFKEQGEVFLNNLKSNGIDEKAFDHVEDVLNRSIEALSNMTIEIKKARELEAL